MELQEMIDKLENADNPLFLNINKSKSAMLMLIGFKKGMTLAKHTTSAPAKLMVLNGLVTYSESNRKLLLSLYESVEIPINVEHEVYASEDSLCMLIKD